MPAESEEVPACAAIRFDLGGQILMVAGRRHSDCLSAANWAHLKSHAERPNEQGFMTTRGRFVGRREALHLMLLANRDSAAEGGYRGNELYSEDLY